MERPRWLTKDYVDKLISYLKSSRLMLVENDYSIYRDYIYTIPQVDPRQLLHAPGYDVADVYRDAVLVKLFGISSDSVDVNLLWRLFRGYLNAKSYVSNDFVEALVREVSL